MPHIKNGAFGSRWWAHKKPATLLEQSNGRHELSGSYQNLNEGIGLECLNLHSKSGSTPTHAGFV
jgi:hypothetical protein